MQNQQYEIVIQKEIESGGTYALFRLAYHAGVLLPDLCSSLMYLSELTLYLYVGGKLTTPSVHPSNRCPFFSSTFSYQKKNGMVS